MQASCCKALIALLATRQASVEGPASEEEGVEHQALTWDEMHSLHSRIDRDGNGKVSMAEVLRLSHDERKASAIRHIQDVLGEIDGDSDGKLTLAEVLRDLEQWGGEDGGERSQKSALTMDLEREKFKLADADKNGLLDTQEFPALFFPETHDGVLELMTKAALEVKDTDKDGLLTLREFCHVGDDAVLNSEDFAKLDKDGNGLLDLEELKAWESGRFHAEEDMKKLFQIADKDDDMHLTAEELGDARELIAGSSAQYHFMEWAAHYEL